MVDAPRWGGLRPEPYDPDAVDADNDGIVQEGTAWERPVGTRLLDDLGREIIRGHTSITRPAGLRYIDRNGKEVSYTPRGLNQPAPGVELKPPTSSLGRLGAPSLREQGLTLNASGVRSLRDQGMTLESAGFAKIGDLMVPAPEPAIPAGPAPRPLDQQLVDTAVSRWLYDTGDRFRNFFDALLEDRRAVPKGSADIQHEQAAVLLDIVANAPTTNVPLFRGERIGLTEEQIAELYRAGESIDMTMRGFSKDEKIATKFSKMGDDGMPVVFELAPGARAAKLDDVSGLRFEADEAEHLVSGTMRVESVRFEGRGTRRHAVVTLTETDPLEPHPSGSYLSILERDEGDGRLATPGPTAPDMPEGSLLTTEGIAAAREAGLWSDLPDGEIELPYDPAAINFSPESLGFRGLMGEEFDREIQSALDRTLAKIAHGLAEYRDDGSDPMDIYDELEAALAEALGTTDISNELTNRALTNLEKNYSDLLSAVTDPNRGLSMAVDAEGLRGLLLDGRYKSQFETGISGGVFNPDSRRDVEYGALGIPEDLPDHLRPVYGYAYADDRELVEMYGQFDVELHPGVRSRSTITFGDSLDAVNSGELDDFDGTTIFRGASALTDPNGEFPAEAMASEFRRTPMFEALMDALGSHLPEEMSQAGVDESDLLEEFGLAPGSWGGADSPINYSYVEAQIHGGVSLHDVAEIKLNLEDANSADDLGESEQRLLRQIVPLLEEHKIPFSGIDADVLDEVLERGEYAPLLTPEKHAEVVAEVASFSQRARNLDFAGAEARYVERLDEITTQLDELAPDDPQVPRLMVEQELLEEELMVLDRPAWAQSITGELPYTPRVPEFPGSKPGQTASRMEDIVKADAIRKAKDDRVVRGDAILNVEATLRSIADEPRDVWVEKIDEEIESTKVRASRLMEDASGPDDPKIREAAVLSHEVQILSAKRSQWEASASLLARREARGTAADGIPETAAGRADLLAKMDQMAGDRTSLEWPSMTVRARRDQLRARMSEDLALIEGTSRSGKTFRAVPEPMQANGEFTGRIEIDEKPIGRFRLGTNLEEQSVHYWDVHVDPAHQRDGIGTTFLDSSLEAARGAGFKRATMRAISDDSHNGVSSWVKAGWEVDGPLGGAEGDVAKALEIMGVDSPDKVTTEKLREHVGELEGLSLNIRLSRDLAKEPVSVSAGEDVLASPAPQSTWVEARYVGTEGAAELMKIIGADYETALAADRAEDILPNVYYSTGRRDEALEVIARAQGFDAMPTQVSQETADELVAAGGVRIYRGANPTATQGLQGGDYYGGRGVNGAGYYFSSNPSMARPYGQAPYERRNDPIGDRMTEMVLRPDARIISASELREELQITGRSLPTDLDMGHVAALRGYDALFIDESEDPDPEMSQVYVVLNRGALALPPQPDDDRWKELFSDPTIARPKLIEQDQLYRRLQADPAFDAMTPSERVEYLEPLIASREEQGLFTTSLQLLLGSALRDVQDEERAALDRLLFGDNPPTRRGPRV